MRTLGELKEYVVKMIRLHPVHKDEILEFYQLACDEVEDGGSESHEVGLAVSDIEELVYT
jgi:hypothetical protein